MSNSPRNPPSGERDLNSGYSEEVRNYLQAHQEFSNKFVEALMAASANEHVTMSGGAQNHPPEEEDLISNAANGDIIGVRNFLQITQEYEGKIAAALVAASANGHPVIVRLLLTAGADADSRDEHGVSALLRACLSGEHIIVAVLLEAGADPNLQCEFGATALNAACETGNIECAKVLLHDPHTFVDLRNDFGETSLFRAVLKGHSHCLEFLINTTGADVNAMDANGATPLMIAAEKNFSNCVQLLLDVPEIEVNAIDEDGRTALYSAIENVSRESMELLLKTEGLDLDIRDFEGKSHLDAACNSGDLKNVRRLIELGVKITPERRTNRTALMYMASIGNIKLVLHLLHHGTSVIWCDSQNKNALYFAAANRHFECLNILAQALKDSDKEKACMRKLFLRSAKMRGIFRSLPILLEYNIFRWSWFPEYDCRLVRSLLQKLVIHGVPPKHFVMDDLISTPLHHALMMKDLGQVKYILANLYLTQRDVGCFQRDTAMCNFITQTGSKRIRKLYRNIYQTPWRLETLALLKVSSFFKMDENRHKAVDNSQLREYLPEQCLTRLSFRSSIRWLDVRKWDEIPVDGLYLQPPEVPGQLLAPHETLNIEVRLPKSSWFDPVDIRDDAHVRGNLVNESEEEDGDEEDEEKGDSESSTCEACGGSCLECREQTLDENDFLIL